MVSSRFSASYDAPLAVQALSIASARKISIGIALDVAELRSLFYIADSDRDGILEWNSGEVAAYGKAILVASGVDAEDVQTLLYNVFSDLKIKHDTKMDIDMGIEFAVKVLDCSSGKLLDGSSANVSHQRFAPAYPFISSMCGPYTRPVYENSMGRSGDEDGKQTQALIQTNAKLRAENQQLSARLAKVEAPQTIDSKSRLYELEKLHSEAEHLAQVVQSLQEKLEVTSHVNVFAHGANESNKIVELERQNQSLRDQLLSLQSSADTEGVLNGQLAHALKQHEELQATSHDLLERLQIGPGSGSSLVEMQARVEAMEEKVAILRSENESLRDSQPKGVPTGCFENAQFSLERLLRNFDSIQLGSSRNSN